jgi:hypothetical protein
MPDARRIAADVLDGTISHIVVDGTLYEVAQDDHDADPYLIEVGPFDPQEGADA